MEPTLYSSLNSWIISAAWQADTVAAAEPVQLVEDIH
jgi:hypothetical protein